MSTPAIPGYTFDASRGSGAFGTVWRAHWSGEFECAVKVLMPGTWHPRYLTWCLEKLRREGERADIVRIYSYDLTNEPPHLSMTLMPEGTMTLEQLSGRLPAREAWALLDGLAGTLAWLHQDGVVHTGLSGGNVFVCAGPTGEPAVLVSDIGQGWLTDAPVTTLHGQIAFIAPEHWRDATKLLQDGHAKPRDVYAFGVIAWRLLTGTWPRAPKVFDAIATSQGEDLNLQAGPFADWLEKEPDPAWPAEPASPEESTRRSIVERCLALEPHNRYPDMIEAMEALKLCPLPPPAVASTVEDIAVEISAAGSNGSAAAGTDTGAAFAEDKPAPPRRRRFSLPLPRLSLRLQHNREGARWSRLLFGPVTAALALLAVGGVTVWAIQERSRRRSVTEDLVLARSAYQDLQSRLPRAESDAEKARREAEAARMEQAAASRNAAVELAGKVLATEPVEDGEVTGWRAAVRAMTEQCSAILANAPTDPAGMEARWQFARLKSALGEDEGALPVLEKLSHDLEAFAITAAGDFPAELVRLTGRVESLTGRILTNSGRTEDALPHLRKASDAFEKWLSSNTDDVDSSRACAKNLLLEGRALAARSQPDQARSALMKIEGLTGRPDDSNFRPEDYFLLSDAQVELGRIDTAQAGASTATDPAGKEAAFRLLETALGRQTDGVNLLLEYDKKINKRSVPCRSRLARGFFDMGRLLARTDQGRDASVAYGESVRVYTELIQEFPDENSWKMELSVVYNEAAQLIRYTMPGVEGAKEALTYQDFSVRFLTTLNESMPLDNVVRLLLAGSLALNGELLQDSGDTSNALKRQTEAVKLTTELLAENSLNEKERREARRTAARAWTATARLHERAGRPDDSIAALHKALTEWESSPVEDPKDQKLMAWVKERLDKLKTR